MRSTAPEDQAKPLLAEQQAGGRVSGAARSDYGSTRLLSTASNAQDDVGGTPASIGSSTWSLCLKLAGIAMLCFIGAIDGTLIATLAGPIATSFNDLQLVSWLQSSFFLANIISQPLAGRATDTFGRRPGLFLAAGLFTLGNLVCAVAPSSATMLLGRLLTGLGGGAIGPIATFCVGDMLPLRSRGLYIAALNTCFSVGASIGAPFGGYLNDTLGWRSAFYLQVPPTLLAVLLSYVFMHIPNEPASLSTPESKQLAIRQLDLRGALCLAITMTFFVIGTTIGGNLLPWKHPLVIGALISFAISMYVFVRIELRASLPVLPLKMLRIPSLLWSTIALFFATMLRYGIFFYAPLFFLAQGYTTTETGLRFLPSSVAIALGSLMTGYLLKSTGRYYHFQLFLSILSTANIGIILAFFTRQCPDWLPFVAFFVDGFTHAGILGTTLMSSVSSAEQRDHAVVTSLGYVFRSTGSVATIVLGSAVFQNLLRVDLESRLGTTKSALQAAKRVREDLKAIPDLPPSWRNAAIEAYVDALRGVWGLLLVFAVICVGATFLVKENKLSTSLDRPNEEQTSDR